MRTFIIAKRIYLLIVCSLLLAQCKRETSSLNEQNAGMLTFSVGNTVFTISKNDVTGLSGNTNSRNGVIPVFTANGKVYVNDTEQISGVSAVDLTMPLTYKVIDNNGLSYEYKVKLMSFTGLPIVTINTDGGKEIVSEDDYLNATFALDPNGNDSAKVISATGSIKGRGNSTWGFIKKPYKFKFDKKTSLFGSAPSKEWVLLANYADKTLIRNYLANTLSASMKMAFSPMSEFVELYLNGKYNGNYMLTDQVEVSPSRVNIDELTTTDTDPSKLTGGYMMEIDQRIYETLDAPFFESRFFPVTVKSPKTPTDGQMSYIKGYVLEAENVLYGTNYRDPVNGFRKYFDEDSFIKWFIINEIFKNVDSQSFSSIDFYKPRNGKIFFGPVWDFDLGAGNATHNPSCEVATGFYTLYHKWFVQMYEDPAFKVKVAEIWKQYRTTFLNMNNLITDEGKLLEVSELMNFRLWPNFSDPSWCVIQGKANYAEHVAWLRQFLTKRIDWLDQQFK